jgi:hypothetical protein
MEKEIKNIEVVIKNRKSGDFVLEVKEIENISREINDEIKRELSYATDNSVIIYSNNKIINLNNLYINTSSIILE